MALNHSIQIGRGNAEASTAALIDGELYYKKNTNQLYIGVDNNGTATVINIQGPTGARGATGPGGGIGPTGPQGNQGPQGSYITSIEVTQV